MPKATEQEVVHPPLSPLFEKVPFPISPELPEGAVLISPLQVLQVARQAPSAAFEEPAISLDDAPQILSRELWGDETPGELSAKLAILFMLRGSGADEYYEAAQPGYRKAFIRDTETAARLMGSLGMLRTQMQYSAKRMGTKLDPVTGEEPGKFPHEVPGAVTANGLLTTFNSCDSVARFLSMGAMLIEENDEDVMSEYGDEIKKGIRYVYRHTSYSGRVGDIENPFGLFVEDPMFSGTVEFDGRQRHFGLKRTDWEDSELNRADPEKREPYYPVVYSLAHFQNADAMLRLGQALGNYEGRRLENYGRYMMEAGIKRLWRGDHFVSAVDGYGDVDEKPSSDTLQALLYIPPEIAAKHLPRNYRELVQSYMQQLETEFGYRANIPAKDGEGGVDPYHTYVWIYQNAELHAASVLHGLDAPKEVAQRSRALIDPADGIYPECADEGGNITGNVWQLWTMAAYLYFCHPERSFTIPKPK
jgi:hypothetical protein